MSSWRPERSPSPPYRSRRYSPSRAVSPLPSRPEARMSTNTDNSTYARPVRSEHYSPPKTSLPLRPRSRSPSPRHRETRYREKSYSPPPRREENRYRSPPPVAAPRRNRPGAADFYDDPPRDERRSMIADREEERTREIPPPRREKVEQQWERGRQVEESVRYLVDSVWRLHCSHISLIVATDTRKTAVVIIIISNTEGTVRIDIKTIIENQTALENTRAPRSRSEMSFFSA
jgi:hypothetical protein